MKYFLIKYQVKNGSPEDWHQEIERFITALDGDPVLSGRISYRCMRADNDSGSYYHIAGAASEDAVKALQDREFFRHYTKKSKRVSGGSLEVLPLAIIAETSDIVRK